MFENSDIISTYTRQQAVQDGLQVKIEGELAEMARQLYKHPIYLTRSVYDLIDRAVNNERYGNDWAGVLWDILWMSQKLGQDIASNARKFEVIITGTGRRKYHTMIIKCGPTDIDDPSPALTVMLPGED